jgi:hypothetical protein
VPVIDIPSVVVGVLRSPDDAYSVPDLSPVGTLVYFSGTNEVRAADNSDISTAPCKGIILAKGAVAVATVLYAGEMDGFSGLTPGQDVFLGTSGALIQSGSLPSAPGSIIQKVGSATSPTKILFFPNQVIIL